MYNKKYYGEKYIWVFKRVLHSPWYEHIQYRKIAPSNMEQAKRGGWWTYKGESSVREYIEKYKDRWDNPWLK